MIYFRRRAHASYGCPKYADLDVAFFLTFIHALISFWIIYFMPVCFQAVLLEGPTRSGILRLPTVVTIVPGGLISGLVLAKFGRYRPLHLVGFAMMTLGIGLFIMLDQHSHLALYVVFQIIAGIGSGLALTTLLPATQAVLSEKDTASSTAVWSFVRSFGTVWGVSVPAAVFNSRADALAYRTTDQPSETWSQTSRRTRMLLASSCAPLIAPLGTKPSTCSTKVFARSGFLPSSLWRSRSWSYV